MSIFKNLRKVHSKVAFDSINNVLSPIGSALNDAATAALYKGIGSPEWESYMAIFAENQEQLTRLTVIDQNEPQYLTQMRAYIVTNGICDMGTNGDLTKNTVTSTIDGDPQQAAANPVVSDVPNDPNGTIASKRPPNLRTLIP